MRISDWSSDVCSSDLDRSRLCPSRRADLFQHAQDDHLWRVERDPAQHHREDGARPLMARRPREGGDRNRPYAALQHRTYSGPARSEEHTSELQSLMRISYAVFCLKKKKKNNKLPIT